MLANEALRVLGVVVVVVAISAGGARADELSEDLSRSGVELAKDGDYAGAIQLFKRAFAGDAKAKYLCNIGMAFYAQDDFARAHLYLHRCFAKTGAPVEGMTEPFRYAVSQLDKGEFAELTIRSNPAGATVSISTLPDELRFAAPQVVYLPVGSHAIRLELEEHQAASQSVTLTARNTQSILIALVEKEKPPVIELVPTVDPLTTVPPDTRATSESRWRRKPVLIGAALTTVALGTSIGLRMRAGSLHNSEIVACDACPLSEGPIYDKRRDRVERWYYSSLVMFGVTGALAAATAVLFALPGNPASKETAGSTQAIIVPQHGGVMVQVSLSR